MMLWHMMLGHMMLGQVSGRTLTVTREDGTGGWDQHLVLEAEKFLKATQQQHVRELKGCISATCYPWL